MKTPRSPCSEIISIIWNMMIIINYIKIINIYPPYVLQDCRTFDREICNFYSDFYFGGSPTTFIYYADSFKKILLLGNLWFDYDTTEAEKRLMKYYCDKY